MNHAKIPTLNAEQVAASQALTQHIVAQIQAQGGSIPFSQFMQLALYARQHGYYTGGAHKIGTAGDFITAPTLTPLFAETLAVQLLPLLPQTAGHVYEFGAGTGALATNLLNHLSGSLKNYYIIELSRELCQRQQQYIQQHAPQHAHKVQWLNTLPQHFDGILIGNEVLDAMPIERIRQTANGQLQRAHVILKNQQFAIQYQALTQNHLIQAAQNYFPRQHQNDYTSELHPTQHAFIQTLAKKITRGGMIWIDYGFDCYQYYHPQRDDGTLIAHHRHHSIHDPFYRIGLSDLTAHINFSDIAQAGVDAGLELIGYTTQAHFLLNLGLLDILTTAHPKTDSPAYLKTAHAVQQLINQHEMGELFKVIAFGKHIQTDWQGFTYGDMCHKL